MMDIIQRRPLSPGFKFDRYDRELRRQVPLHPEFATESKVWRREHVIANTARPDVPESYNVAIPATSRGQWLEF